MKYGLIPHVECVGEALGRYNGALRDEGSTVGIVGTGLKYTVPVLERISVL